MMTTGFGSEGFERRRPRRPRENDPYHSDTEFGDELNQDAPSISNNQRRKYHRHSPHQIQNLEALFKESHHPDEKQIFDLSIKLNLERQMKTQLERHENTVLRQENDKLRAEDMSLKEAMRKLTCANRGNPGVLGEINFEEQQLEIPCSSNIPQFQSCWVCSDDVRPFRYCLTAFQLPRCPLILLKL